MKLYAYKISWNNVEEVIFSTYGPETQLVAAECLGTITLDKWEKTGEREPSVQGS